MALNIDLQGRRALVTGVTDGIGVGISKRLAQAGCDIAGCGRRAEDSPQAQAFIHLVESHGRRASYLSADLSAKNGPAEFAAFAIESLGGLDIVVSNAGRNIFEGVNDCDEAQWNACIELDLASHWRLGRSTQSALANGSDSVFIINSSNHAFSTLPGCFPYNVAKAGLVAMVQSMALEWGPNTRAVGIAPGFIDTPGGDTWFASFPDPAEKRGEVERAHPVGRIGTPEEIGGLCAFLASADAAFINGTTILIDGGHGAHMGW